MKDKITQERLIELFNYDLETGLFSRKVKIGNNCKMDRPVGRISTGGYLMCKIDGVYYTHHRLAWLYVYGKWPLDQLDHIDCNKLNNSILNLREASRSQNMCNKNKMSHNTSGYKGVFWDKQSQKWKAQITINKKQKCLGRFDCPKKAYEVYCEKAKELHLEFHNFG